MSLAAQVQRALLLRLASLPDPVLRRIVGPPVRSPEGESLDLEAQLLLRMMQWTKRPELNELGTDGARRNMEGSTPIVDYQGVRVTVRDRTIPGPAGAIPVRIFEPRSGRAPRPVLVYFHGGGFVVGSPSSHDGVCRALAQKTGALVVSVHYRLAPEHRFPAAVEDAIAATRWVLAEAASIGGDSRRVAVGGDSAGGNLAAVSAQATKDDAVRPVFQLLVYPATDMTRSLPSHTHFRSGVFLPKPTIDWFLGCYLNDEREQRDPRASPLFAKDVQGVAPAMVITAGFDPLRDEGRAYADKMREAGVPVDYLLVEGAMHGFFSFGGVFEHAARAVDEAASALSRAFRAVHTNGAGGG